MVETHYVIRCDHPGCKALLDVQGFGGFIDERMNAMRRIVEAGWFRFSGTKRIEDYCPDHWKPEWAQSREDLRFWAGRR